MHTNLKIIKLLPMAILVSLAVVGCKSKTETAQEPKKPWHDPFFPEPGQPTSVGVTFERMAANGAKSDGMLHAQHFDGEGLNSLGMDKLRRMLLATAENAKLKVFVNIPENETTVARMDAVKSFLELQGLPGDKLAVVRGTNPASRGDTTDSILAKQNLRDSNSEDSGGDVGVGIGIAK
jgi:hypothetical protein